MLKFYYDLCGQKKKTPVAGVEEMDANTVKDMVDVLKAYYPASDKQIAIIMEKQTLLTKNNHHIDIDYSSLTGGFAGTASKLIEDLFALEKLYVKTKPTINQLDFACKMYLCNACDFELEGVSRKVTLEDDKWRYCTPEEFANRVSEVFTKQSLSEFINKYRNDFNEWKTTRIRPGQLNHIKQLLERSGSQINELTLMMFSQDEAAKYIEQLLNEAKRPREYAEFEATDGLPRDIKNSEEILEIEENILRDMIYKVIAETGYEPDNVDAILATPQLLKEYFIFLIQDCYIAPDELVRMMEDSTILKDLFEEDLVKTA